MRTGTIVSIFAVGLGLAIGCKDSKTQSDDLTPRRITPEPLLGCDYAAPCTTQDQFCWWDPNNEATGILWCDTFDHVFTTWCASGNYCDETLEDVYPTCIDSEGTILTCDTALLALYPYAIGTGGSPGEGGTSSGGTAGVSAAAGIPGTAGGGALSGFAGAGNTGSAGIPGTGGSGGIAGASSVGGSAGSAGASSVGGTAGLAGVGGTGNESGTGSGGEPNSCPPVEPTVPCAPMEYGCFPPDVSFCLDTTSEPGINEIWKCLCPNPDDGNRGTWLPSGTDCGTADLCWDAGGSTGGAAGTSGTETGGATSSGGGQSPGGESSGGGSSEGGTLSGGSSGNPTGGTGNVPNGMSLIRVEFEPAGTFGTGTPLMAEDVRIFGAVVPQQFGDLCGSLMPEPDSMTFVCEFLAPRFTDAILHGVIEIPYGLGGCIYTDNNVSGPNAVIYSFDRAFSPCGGNGEWQYSGFRVFQDGAPLAYDFRENWNWELACTGDQCNAHVRIN